MILTCPACTARFAVPDALIPPEGRTVKCGRCANQWHADKPIPMENEAFADMAMDASQSGMDPNIDPDEEALPVVPRQLPVVQPKIWPLKPFIIAVPVLTCLWLVLAIMAYYPRWMELPVLRSLYSAMGITSTEGLAFDDTTMQRNKAGTKTQFLLAGSIANQSSERRIVPTVRVQLKNKEGEILWSRDYEVNEPLEPGGVYPFRIPNVETSFADSVTSIVLDLGHPLQLMMR